MQSLITNTNIEKQAFSSLIDLCFSHSDTFSLTRYGGHAKPQPPNDTFPAVVSLFEQALARQDEILNRLSSERISSFVTDRWFYIHTTPKLYVDLYRTTQTAKEALLQCYDNLFLASNCRLSLSPADLCFFKDDLLWFGSNSHEEICIIWPPDSKTAVELQMLGKWEESEEDEQSRRFCLSNFLTK